MTRRTLEFLSSRRVAGFTLVEMVVAIVILGILGTVLTAFITRPVEGYRDLARRTALVDAAESALRRMQRDIRIALPNSVRRTNLGGGGFALEMLPTLDGGKFREVAFGGTTACEQLNFGTVDTDYDIIGGFHNITPGVYTNFRMVVNNRGTPGNDAYEGSASVITPLGRTITVTRPSTCAPGTTDNNDHVNLNVGHQYGGSAVFNRRIYVITTPVTYLCTPNASDPVAGTLVQYSAYNISSTQPTNPAVAPLATATSTLITSRVSACSVTTTSSDIRGRSLVTLTLDLAEEEEQIRLINQTQLNNSR